jgi:hypothetical protein
LARAERGLFFAGARRAGFTAADFLMIGTARSASA